MLKFKKVKAKNFMSIGSKGIELNLDNQGLVLVEGENDSDPTFSSNGGGKCLSPDTKVFSPEDNGYITIKRFVDERREYILGVNSKNMLEPMRVNDWHKIPNKNMYEITTSLGDKVKVADTHPIQSDGKLVRAAELKVGDWIAEARKLPASQEFDNRFPLNYLFSIGALIGDGGLTGKSLSFTNMELEMFNSVEKGLQEKFPGVYFSENYGNRGKAYTSRVLNVKKSGLESDLEMLDLRHLSKEKYLTNDFKSSLNRKQIEYLLSGMYNTDGEIPRDSNKSPRRSINLTTASKRLAKDIQELWLRIDVPVRIRERKIKGYEQNTYYVITPMASCWNSMVDSLHLVGENKKRLENVVSFFENKDILKVPQNNVDVIPTVYNKGLGTRPVENYSTPGSKLEVHRTKKQLENHCFSRETYNKWAGKDNTIGNSDYVWAKVVSIKTIPNEDCYDVTVDSDNHLYVADNFIVHNSSSLSTITYALYGETPTGLKADNVINRNNKKNLSVILEFEKDNYSYRVERYRKHHKNKNKVLFFQNDEDITQKSTADTDKKIQSVFGIDMLTYMNSIAYGQGDTEVFAKATDKGKKQILENLADIGVYQYAQEIAKEKAKQRQEELQEVKNEVQKLEQEKGFLEQSYEKEKQNYESTAQAIKRQEDQVSEISQSLEEKKTENSEVIPRIQEKLQELDYNIGQVQSYKVDEALKEKVQSMSEDINKLINASNQIVSAISDKKKELEKVTRATNCPVCGAPLDKNHREQEMNRLEQEISQSNEKLNQISEARDSYDKSYTQEIEKLKKEEQKQESYQQSYQGLINSKSQYEMKKQEAEHNLENKEQELEQAENTLEQLKQVPQPMYDKARAKEIDKQEKDLEEKRVKIDNERNQYQTLADEVFSNKGIRSAVLDLITPFLNDRANHYLSTLSGSDIEVLFSTQTQTAKGELRDKFDLTVLNGSGGETYQSNSEGEKKRIDLAVSFAIQDLVQSKSDIAVNLGIYDECFDGLDAVGCENVIKILQERQKEIPSIFVITHNDSLKSLFEKSIKVKKTGGETTIEKETTQ